MEWLNNILDSSLRPIILGLAGGLLAYFISVYAVKKRVKKKDDKITLRVGKNMKLLVWLLMILTIFIIITAILSYKGQLLAAILVVSLLLYANYYLIKNILRTEVTFDNDIINIKRKKYNVEFKWNEINSFKYSHLLNSYSLKVNEKNIYISGYLDGIDNFKEKLLKTFDDFARKNIDVLEILKTAIGNKELLKESYKCGCFSCLSIFNYNDIYDFVEATDKTIRYSAICPNCSEIETVIGDASGVAITEDNLIYLNESFNKDS